MKSHKNFGLKMFTHAFFICIIGLNINLAAQNPAFSWVESISGNDGIFGVSVDTDISENVYLTGTFEYTADFDPGINNYSLSSMGNSDDIFVLKLSSNGSFVWALQIGGTGIDGSRSIFVTDNGNIYITGHYTQTVDFDPGMGVFNLTSNGSSDIFVLKLNSNGVFQWAKGIGGMLPDSGNDIAVDKSGNVYVTGFFESTVDFNPGVQTYNLSVAGVSDAFVLKLDPNGNFVWAAQLGGAGTNEGTSLALDTIGNAYTTGYFDSTSDFDPGTQSVKFTALGQIDVFISKLDYNGNYVWAKHIGGQKFERSNCIDVDAAGNSVITGFFDGSPDFDPGAQIFSLTAAGQSHEDAFAFKLDASGVFQWAHRFGDLASDRSQAVKQDASGNVYLTGYFNARVDFDPGQSSHFLTSTGSTSDLFILKLNKHGNFIWVFQAGGSAAYAYPMDIALTSTRNVFTAGYYDGTIDFNLTGGTGTNILTSVRLFDGFVHRLTETNTALSETKKDRFCEILQGKNGDFNLKFNKLYKNIRCEVYGLTGNIIFAENFSNCSSKSLRIDLKTGIYFFSVNAGNGNTLNSKLIYQNPKQ